MTKISLRYGTLALAVCFSYGSIAFASDQLRTCEVNVNNDFSYSGLCLVRSHQNSDVIYLLTASVVSQQKPEHFFYLPHGSEAEATWNLDPTSSHAHDYLGTFKQSVDCYLGESFSICSEPLWD